MSKPDQSFLEVDQGGRVHSYVGTDAISVFRARVLASSLVLFDKTGMIPTRGFGITRMLAAATQITGKKYKRGDTLVAAADVEKWMETMQAALPVVGPQPTHEEKLATLRREEKPEALRGEDTGWSYKFNPPPVCSAQWNHEDWIKHIGTNWFRKGV